MNISPLSGNWRSDNTGCELYIMLLGVQMGAEWNRLYRDQVGPSLKYSLDVYAIYLGTCRDTQVLNKLLAYLLARCLVWLFDVNIVQLHQGYVLFSNY